MNALYVADIKGAVYEELTKAELQQLFHGMEFAIGNFDTSVKAGHLANLMNENEQASLRKKLVTLRDKLEKLIDRVED